MRKIVLITLVLFGVNISAQEMDLPQYVNHMADNPFLISPAYAGIGAGLQVRLNGVSQWIGVKGAPNTQSLTVEFRIADRFGGGVTVFNDSNGETTQQGARLSLASHLTLSDLHDSFLSFGLTYNFLQFGIDTNLNNTDQLDLTSIGIGKSNFDLSMLYRFERFAISVNLANLLDKKIHNFDTGEPEVLRRFSAYTLYTFRVDNIMEIEPSIFLEHFEASKRSRTDANIKARRRIYNGYVWAGLSYTFLNDQFLRPLSLSPLLGLKKDKFYVSYGFSVTTNEIADFNYGTHMITLGFDYDKQPSLARCTQKMLMF